MLVHGPGRTPAQFSRDDAGAAPAAPRSSGVTHPGARRGSRPGTPLRAPAAPPATVNASTPPASVPPQLSSPRLAPQDTAVPAGVTPAIVLPDVPVSLPEPPALEVPDVSIPDVSVPAVQLPVEPPALPVDLPKLP